MILDGTYRAFPYHRHGDPDDCPAGDRACQRRGSLMLPSLTETQRLAEAARQGLRMVAEGEDKTIEGWLIYGRALLAGRELLVSNNKFHEWKVSSQLATTSRDDEAAAMWAAADEATFEETRKLHPRVRTVRGLHAKWKEAQRPVTWEDGKSPEAEPNSKTVDNGNREENSPCNEEAPTFF